MTDASQLNVQEKNSGDTPLIAACRRGNVKVVEYLLKNGADVHLTNQVGLRATDAAGLWEFNCVFECRCVCVSETEDMSSLRLQEDILATRLPDDRHSDAYPAAWLLCHGKKQTGAGVWQTFSLVGHNELKNLTVGEKLMDGVIWWPTSWVKSIMSLDM